MPSIPLHSPAHCFPLVHQPLSIASVEPDSKRDTEVGVNPPCHEDMLKRGRRWVVEGRCFAKVSPSFAEEGKNQVEEEHLRAQETALQEQTGMLSHFKQRMAGYSQNT